MSTPTTTYAFDLPAAGGDDDTWGTLLNGNWTALDDFFTATFDSGGSEPAGSLGFLKSTILPNPITERIFFSQANRPQVSIKRADNTINASLRFFGTSGLGVEVGMGDNGVFAVGPDGSLIASAGTRSFWVNCNDDSLGWAGVASGDGSGITDLNATELTSGTIPNAVLPTDSTERDRVMALIAGASLGAVGMHAFANRVSGVATTPGDSVAGSDLLYAGIRNSTTTQVSSGGSALPGTWMALGRFASSTANAPVTLFVRIA